MKLSKNKTILIRYAFVNAIVLVLAWGCAVAEPYPEEQEDNTQETEPFHDDFFDSEYDDEYDDDSELDGGSETDECPDDPDKTEPGECGCGQAEGTCGLCPSELLSKERLYVGEYICSENGDYQFGMSEDGDLALWLEDEIVWTASISDGHYTHMQIDGNLVIYNADMVSIWASNTSGNNGAYLTVENDGQVIIWLDSQIVWSIGGDV